MVLFEKLLEWMNIQTQGNFASWIYHWPVWDRRAAVRRRSDDALKLERVVHRVHGKNRRLSVLCLRVFVITKQASHLDVRIGILYENNEWVLFKFIKEYIIG